jgi:hypothetical protein
MRRVVLIDSSINLRVRWLHGTASPTREDTPISFDDKSSFAIEVESGAIGISAIDLTRLMNDLLTTSRSPLRNVKIVTRNGRLLITGTLHKGVDIPIEMLGDVETAQGGKLRVHAEKLRALHVSVKGLFNAFGLKVSDLIDFKQAKGMTIQDNDVILNPQEMLPPPHARGSLTDVGVQENELVLFFGDNLREVAETGRRDNYMSFQGGTIHFGKLTMQDADLVMVDDARDPWFYFFLDHYQQQVIAGYSRVTPKSGLVIYMPDFNRLNK